MSDDACYCDFERPDVYTVVTPVARVEHECNECGRKISRGERYERARMLYEGRWDCCDTCHRCLRLREWVKAHVPCFCWLHGRLLEDAYETIESLPVSEVAPGMWFEFGRLYVACTRNPKVRHDKAA